MSKAGFSILEVLIAAGIMAIVTLGIATSIANLQKQNKAVQQKLESIELKQQLISIFSSRNSCKCMFVDNQLTAIPTNLRTTNLQNLTHGCISGNWITPAANVPGTQTNLKISSVELVNFLDVGLVAGTQYTADLQINFDPSSTVFSLKPITIKQAFLSASNRISNCESAQSPPTGIWTSGRTTIATYCNSAYIPWTAGLPVCSAPILNTGCSPVGFACYQATVFYTGQNSQRNCRAEEFLCP